MDVDAFVARNQDAWNRLDHLSRTARKPANLRADDLAELVSLYQRTSTHLAHSRTVYPAEQALLARLTMSVAGAHSALHGKRNTAGTGTAVRRFFTDAFPAAAWRFRRFIVVSLLLTIVPWIIMTVWVSKSPDAFRAVDREVNAASYVDNEFEDYYSSEPAQNFTSKVFLNNIRVAALAFVAGILLCVITVWLLVYNGINVGIAGGLFTYDGQWQRFWGLILPHGMLEISAIVVSGAAGLTLGWAVISPGDRRRVDAVAEEGRHAGNVLLGLVLALGVAAMIEGFVTGHVGPVGVRIGIGAVAVVAFWAWILIRGPKASAQFADA